MADRVTVKLASRSAVRVRKWAEKLGARVIRLDKPSLSGVFMGFLAKATRTSKGAVVVVMDAPAVVEVPGLADGNGLWRMVFPNRDVLNPQSTPPVPLVPGDPRWQNVPSASLRMEMIGAPTAGPNGPLVPSVGTDKYYNVTHDRRFYMGDVRMFGTPTQTLLGLGSAVTGVSGAMIGLWPALTAVRFVTDAFLHRVAPGYSFVAITNFGYVLWQHQTMHPYVATAPGGRVLVAAPVVRVNNKANIADWGHAGIAIMVLDFGAEDPLVFGQLWTPDNHPSTFFHNGPWHQEPAGMSPFYWGAQWAAFWDNWGGAPTGSHPVWTDSLSAAWHADGWTINFLTTSVNTAYNTAPGLSETYAVSGVVPCRLRLTRAEAPDGTETFSLAESFGQYEVQAANWSGQGHDNAAYNQWVVGALPTSSTMMRIPMATLTVGDRLVEVHWVAEGERRGAYVKTEAFGYVAGTGRLEVAVDGALQHTLGFDEYGMGIVVAADVGAIGRRLLNVASSPMPRLGHHTQFVEISDREMGFITVPDWAPAYPYSPQAGNLVVLDLTTGVFTTRSAVGAVDGTPWGSFAPSLSCVQRATIDQGTGVESAPGVLLFTSKFVPGVSVSYDSGRTWQALAESVVAPCGAYYAGNALAQAAPGAAF